VTAGRVLEKVVERAHVFAAAGEVDLDAYQFDLTVTNESDTFNPLSAGLQPFAEVLVHALDLPQLNYRGHARGEDEPVQGVVQPARQADFPSLDQPGLANTLSVECTGSLAEDSYPHPGIFLTSSSGCR